MLTKEIIQTPLHSPETPNLDQVLFPSQVGGDLGYLDTPFGEYSPDGYGGDASQFPLQFGHRTSTSLPEGYELSNSNNNSAASPGMYGGAGVWPAAAHMSPAAFLPTPPMGDELTGEDSVEEELTGSKRKRRSAATDDAAAAGNVGKRKSKRAQTQLRTASRAPKKRTANTIHKPAESAEEVKARAAHNQVEQQYRKRLNAHFEKLLAVLPPPDEIDGITSSGGGARDGIGDRRVSKAEVLDMARQRIRALERETAALERERRELRGRIGGFEGQWRRGAPL